MIYSIAGLTVKYEPRYERLRLRSMKYMAENQSQKPDIEIYVSEEEIDAHLQKYEVGRELAEYVLMGVAFYKAVLDFDAFFLHSSAVCVEGLGYAFTGHCGAGKSTHSALWREYFKEKAVPVNDDKPVIRLIDGKICVCGTPFSGKYDINSNTIVPLKGICVMVQSAENSIEKLSVSKAMSVIMEQTLRPEEPLKMIKLLELLDSTLSKVPVYSLSCRIDKEAVELSYNTMKNN